MKNLLVALTCLAVSVSIAHAQEPIAPAKPLATIDPQARDLLARLDARYKRFRTFAALVELRTSEPVPWKYARYRVALDGPFRGAITMAIEGQGTRRSVFDGKTIFATDSKFPCRFTTRKIDAGLYGIRLFLRGAGAEGQLGGILLDDKLASVLLDPDLQSVAMGASQTLDGKPLQSVVFGMAAKGSKGTLTLFIDEENLILRRATGAETISAVDNKTFVFTENYSDVRFDEKFAPKVFSTKAPAGFRPIDSFETGAVTTTAPVERVVN